MKQIRWGILSTGTIARTFAQTVRAMGGEGELYAVASRSQASADAFADQFDIPVRYGSYEELAADPHVDMVYVATPHSRHYEDMELLIRGGKHILCEKSFTTDAGQAEEIFALARARGVFVMEAFWTRFVPLYAQIERILAEGELGEIRAVTAQYGYTTGRQARKFDPALAGGTLLDIGVYAVGFACMVLGDRFDQISGCLIPNAQGTDATDAILLRRGGAAAQLTCAIGVEIPTCAAIYGTRGRIEIPEFKAPQRATLWRPGADPEVLEAPFEVNGYEYEIREAMACVAAGGLESRRMPAARTVAVMGIMDELRRQNGLRFPFEGTQTR